MEEEDEGPFFDLDLASSDDSDDACSADDLDFIISLHRSRELFCASEPSTKAGQGLLLLLDHKPRQQANCSINSFGVVGTSVNNKSRKKVFYGGRPSFASSTRSSTTLGLFMEDDASSILEPTTSTTNKPRAGARQSGGVIRRYLINISRRLRRTVRPRPPSTTDDRRLRKSRSASALVQDSRRRDDSLVEKQDGIASAIAHCKESFRRGNIIPLLPLLITCSE